MREVWTDGRSSRLPQAIGRVAWCWLIAASACLAPAQDRFPASNAPARRDSQAALEQATPPSPFGVLTSRRWAAGQTYQRQNLTPVPNPHPAPEPQPRRDHPYDVAIMPQGTKVYVALQGNELLPGSEVAVYDVGRDALLGRIPLKQAAEPGPPGSSPYRLAPHPGGRYLLVTHRYSNFISVIDTQRDAVVQEIPADFYCQGITFSSDGRTAYVANRYLDQIFVLDIQADDTRFAASLRVRGGLDEAAFRGDGKDGGIHRLLVNRCGAAGCHAEPQGELLTSDDARATWQSVLGHITPGDARHSRLLQATVRTRYGGYADATPRYQSHQQGTVVFPRPAADPDYRRIAAWIDAGGPGPGIPVGNPGSKPKLTALSSDGRYLFVGNTGTQDVSIVDLQQGREIGAIYLQNVVNDIRVYRAPSTGRDYLLITTLGIGFGTVKEREPYAGEVWDRQRGGAQFSLWRDTATLKRLPRDQQIVLGPFDAVDGTAEIKFRDIQNDLVFIDLGALRLTSAGGSGSPPGPRGEPAKSAADGLEYLLAVNKYESHRAWVRYTSDTAEATTGDIKGDIPPDLMRVVGAFPEKMAVVGERLFVTMQATNQVQEWRIAADSPDPSDYLVPVAVYETGMQPIGIAAGPPGTPAAGKLFVANFLSGSLSVIDTASGASREVLVDPSVARLPVPATNAERGEILVHSALFSSDQDTSCFHCHYLDLGDGRPWGVSQVLGQEFLSPHDDHGQLVIGGTMGTPQMRGLFGIQPFFFEGVISGYEPRSMIMEHCPADDFARANPQGDFTGLEAHYEMRGTADLQSKMETQARYDASQEERRDEMFRQASLRLFGKAFRLRDFQRFVGDWQLHEPRLLPNPFDPTNVSVLRGKLLFEDPQVGCVSCHPPPHFAKKDFPGLRNQALPSLVLFSVRDGGFTLTSKNYEDYVNGVQRDLDPWDLGRAEERQGMFTVFPLRGLWDRPPVFLHNGLARTLREVLCAPGHPALRRFKYEPWLGGFGERPGRLEVGCNMTLVASTREPREVRAHVQSGARIGYDTHGGTSQLTRQQIDDLFHYLNSIE
jgi:YVTN family beta-propeller protein